MTNSENAQVSSKKIDVIRAWMQTQWERIPAVPHSQPGSYARGYDGGLVDVLRGLQATLDKLPPALETEAADNTGAASRGPCPVHGDTPCLRWFINDRVYGHPTTHDAIRWAKEAPERLTCECADCKKMLEPATNTPKAVELRPWECPHCGTLDPYAHAETCGIVNR